MKRYRELSFDEEKIIVHGGTEIPYSGEYVEETTLGIYVCRRCDSPLYCSSDKFSSCGWPSFDDAFPGAIYARTDADGNRTEILCGSCKGHLGHLFIGEKFTIKNRRHCVNSASLLLVPAISKEGFARAIVAAGCFWGVEKSFASLPGVIKTTAGFTGGEVVFPTYEEVCTGLTGHVEAVEIEFDLQQLTYTTILKHFFSIHDYTDAEGQGVDRGAQYRSTLFFLTRAQEKIAQEQIRIHQLEKKKVATLIKPARQFYAAEDYHQHCIRDKIPNLH